MFAYLHLHRTAPPLQPAINTALQAVGRELEAPGGGCRRAPRRGVHHAGLLVHISCQHSDGGLTSPRGQRLSCAWQVRGGAATKSGDSLALTRACTTAACLYRPTLETLHLLACCEPAESIIRLPSPTGSISTTLMDKNGHIRGDTPSSPGDSGAGIFSLEVRLGWVQARGACASHLSSHLPRLRTMLVALLAVSIALRCELTLRTWCRLAHPRCPCRLAS